MKSIRKRTLALTMAVMMTAGALVPAASAMTIPPACDETYYATLDYYGGVQEGSVVKSYRLGGAGSITDYGSYDRVVNLTDDLTPTVDGNTVTFELGEETPEKFYFEGKTTKPFEELPWKISVSYKLNGAPVLAEDLAGKTGLVEIALDVALNPRASEYSRTNLVLTAAAMFNDDDITSLEAPGAEVQMIGNLRSVLFMVLPGEEQHFVIRVGSEDFSFSGLILLAVPATLQQLEQVKDLREAKEKGEDSLDAIGDSMDAILNAMEGMSGSLNAAAGGLDQLNGVRNTVSQGKGQVYDKTDLALGDLDALADALGSLDGYAATAARAVTDLNETLNGLNGTVQGLGPELENTRKIITAIQKDTKALAGLLGDVESYNRKATDIASSLADELEDLEENMDGLELSLRILRNALKGTAGVSEMEKISVMGMTDPAAIQDKVNEVMGYHSQYAAYLTANGLTETQLSFEAFLLGYAYGQYRQAVIAQVKAAMTAMGIPGVTDEMAEQYAEANQIMKSQEEFLTGTEEGREAAAQASQAAQAWTVIGGMSVSELQEQLKTMETVNGQVVPQVNKKIAEINKLITDLTQPTANVVEELADIMENVGDVGVTDDLAALAGLCRDLLKTMKEHEGEGASLLENADGLGDLAGRITLTADGLLGKVEELNDVLNTYEPEVQAALGDVQALSGSAQSTLHDLAGALAAGEGLLRSTGDGLDEGTRNTLAGVSDSLRKATAGLNEIDTIRNAKDTIKTLVDDEWDSHTGEMDGLLNIDAGADPVSMTDPRNPTPGSIQYVMRTQEIKAEDETAEATQREEAPETTFWGRVAALFRGIWEDFKRLLHIG